MEETGNGGLENRPYSQDVSARYYIRGALAKAAGKLEEATLQFSIAAFLLVDEKTDESRLMRINALVSLARTYNELLRFDKGMPVAQEAIALVPMLDTTLPLLRAEALDVLATSQHGLASFEEANENFKESISILSEYLDFEDPYLNEVVKRWLRMDVEWCEYINNAQQRN